MNIPDKVVLWYEFSCDKWVNIELKKKTIDHKSVNLDGNQWMGCGGGCRVRPVNVFPQSMHLKGRDFEWVFSWDFSFEVETKWRPHSRHDIKFESFDVLVMTRLEVERARDWLWLETGIGSDFVAIIKCSANELFWFCITFTFNIVFNRNEWMYEWMYKWVWLQSQYSRHHTNYVLIITLFGQKYLSLFSFDFHIFEDIFLNLNWQKLLNRRRGDY